jgi:hypothetical protein
MAGENRDEQAKSIGIDFGHKRWRFEERVQSLVSKKGFTREEAEEAIKTVIIFKEGPHEENQINQEEG